MRRLKYMLCNSNIVRVIIGHTLNLLFLYFWWQTLNTFTKIFSAIQTLLFLCLLNVISGQRVLVTRWEGKNTRSTGQRDEREKINENNKNMFGPKVKNKEIWVELNFQVSACDPAIPTYQPPYLPPYHPINLTTHFPTYIPIASCFLLHLTSIHHAVGSWRLRSRGWR